MTKHIVDYPYQIGVRYNPYMKERNDKLVFYTDVRYSRKTIKT